MLILNVTTIRKGHCILAQHIPWKNDFVIFENLSLSFYLSLYIVLFIQSFIYKLSTCIFIEISLNNSKNKICTKHYHIIIKISQQQKKNP